MSERWPGCHKACLGHEELPCSHHPDCPVLLAYDVRQLPWEYAMGPHNTEVACQAADLIESQASELARLKAAARLVLDLPGEGPATALLERGLLSLRQALGETNDDSEAGESDG